MVVRSVIIFFICRGDCSILIAPILNDVNQFSRASDSLLDRNSAAQMQTAPKKGEFMGQDKSDFPLKELKSAATNKSDVPTASRRHFLTASASAIAASLSLSSAANAKEACTATERDILGPFHRPGAPFGVVLADEGEPGTRLLLSGQVFGPDCKTPIANALMDIWHADAKGEYDLPKYAKVYTPQQEYRLRRQLLTDADGRYKIETVIPGRYKIPKGLPDIDEKYAGRTRPAHIHLLAAAPGYASLITQLYFEGDPFIAGDPWAGGETEDDHAKNQLKLEPVAEDGSIVKSTFDITLTRG